METEPKIYKWDYITLKSFCTAKETINGKKRPPTEWKKIFANNASDKGLISNIFQRTHTIQYQKKSNEQVEKWEVHWIDTFPKKAYRWPTGTWKHTQITNHQGTTHQNHVEMSPPTSQSGCRQKTTTNKYRRGCRGKGTIMPWWWECTYMRPLWVTVSKVLRKLSRDRRTIQPYHLRIFYERKQKH